MSKTLLLIFLIISLIGMSQTPPFNNQWESVGPNQAPYSKYGRGDLGIGPVEFIRINRQKKGFFLAGSLNGGLFYTEDGGENWINSGSDRWAYSGCAWADFYPDNPDSWYAVSNKMDNNGKPGITGEKGGVFRTDDKGLNWNRIGGIDDFGGSRQLKIYGTRFHPNNSRVLFVMASSGLYYTEDCHAKFVKWIKVPNLKGWIYDLDFLNDKMYVSNFYKGKWNVLEYDLDSYEKGEFTKDIKNIESPLRTITFEPAGDKLLILVDYLKLGDELWTYDPSSQKAEMTVKNLRVNFGSGHTFAVSPFNKEEFYMGYSLQVRRYEKNEKGYKSVQLQSGYHVDVEFVSYDYFDSSKVYLATHGGVFMSDDNAKTWHSISNGLGVAEVMGLAVSATDPKQMVIGCFHDGASVIADFNKDGEYYWRMSNGGDALIPLIDPNDAGKVYTSNQYNGGGVYFSKDTAKSNSNVLSLNKQGTAGWEMAATLHPLETSILYYNFLKNRGEGKGNIDAARTLDASKKMSADTISNFQKSHDLKSYKVFGLFNSTAFPDELYAYVLEFTKDENGKNKTNHLLFKTTKARASAEEIINSWYELEIPRNTWVADVEMDPINSHIIYISYTTPKANPESIFGDKGMIYALKYSKKTKVLRREYDITRNIPSSLIGRYNLTIPANGKRVMFVATRAGVFYGTKKSLKGKRKWYKVGAGLPHCKTFGLDYNIKEQILTVGLLGRGVWRYRF